VRGPLARGGRQIAVTALLLSSAAALAGAFPAVVRIPRRDPSALPSLPPALFSHRTHGSFGCYACHPAIFPQAPIGFTHEEMRGGRFCGRCHQGRTAFAIEGAGCGGCHVH
jgi:c(7)-type cytochrome triheme protein